jgi:hypothetical protein
LKLSPAKKKAKKFDFSAIVASCIDEEGEKEKSMEEEMGEENDIKGNDPCQNGTFTSLFDAAVTIATAAANNSGHSMHNRTATIVGSQTNHPPNQPW